MEAMRVIDSKQARDGVFVSLDEFVGHKGIEIKISDDGVVTIRARDRSLADVCESIDRRREALKRNHGLLSDSSLQIREDRDSR
jgi:hypothetical protein